MMGWPIHRKSLDLDRTQARAIGLWGSFTAPTIVPVVKGRYSFRCKSQEEVAFVWKKGPWILDGVVFGLKQERFDQAFDEVDTDYLSFCIQVHNLPLHYFKESIMRCLGEEVGEVHEICFEDEEGIPYEDIVSLRTIINIQKPIIPTIRLRRENQWICIKYEKLSPICKFCGIINHGEDEGILYFNIVNVPTNLRAWAEMPVPGMEKVPFHFSFGGWKGYPRFRRESPRTWSKIPVSLGGGRMNEGDDDESIGSI